nr:MAG: RNA-dependent RNA polymerase [Riboviria sp.]
MGVGRDFKRPTHRRFVTPLLPLSSFPKCYEVQTHQACPENELRSLHNRHLRDVGVTPTRRGIRLLHRQMLRLTRKIGDLRPCSLETLLARAPSRKKRLYITAAESLGEYEIEERDSRVKMFIKTDRYNAEEVAEKEPRAIQYRTPRYNLALQRYLHPFEMAYYSTVNHFKGGPVKGKNSWERARLYIDAIQEFVDPVVINLDFSKFDAHLHPDVLAEERKLYNRAFGDAELIELLDAQIDNKCTTQTGIKYSVKGTRMSGDVNTGLGNTVIAEAIVRAWASHHGVRVVPFVDGDDIIVILERGNIPPLDFSDWGMECTAEILEPEHLTHCHSKIIWIGNRPRMVRDPWRAISHGACTVRNYPSHILRPLLAAMGKCELACSHGVPVLQEWALAQIRVAASPAWKHFDEALAYRAKLEGRVGITHITPQARDSFASCFGIEVSDQLALEEELRTWTPAKFIPARGVDGHWHKAEEASTWEEA